MKRKTIISAVLALILILSLAACGGGGSNGKSIAKDDHVMALKFTAPESYESVERYSEKKVSGELIEKDITFATEDGSKLVFACMPGRKLSELADTSSWEVINKGGQDYYMYSSGGSLMAFAQVGDDMYAISIDGGREELEDVLDNVKFDGSKTTETDEPDLGKLKYDEKDCGNIYAYTVRRTEDPKGELISSYVQWSYGEDELTLDYRLAITLYKNKSFDELTAESGKTYIEKVYGNTTFGVPEDEDGVPTLVYLQVGSDTYRFANNGQPNWLWVTRTEESEAAFVKLLESVSEK
jgi:hypothetical protein